MIIKVLDDAIAMPYFLDYSVLLGRSNEYLIGWNRSTCQLQEIEID